MRIEMEQALCYSPVSKPMSSVKNSDAHKKMFKKRRPKSATKIQSKIKKSNKMRYSFASSKGARQYHNAEKFMMKTVYEIFQFIGETELHIETLR